MPPYCGLKLGVAGAIQACVRLYKDQERTTVGGQALSVALACAFTRTEVKVEQCRVEPGASQHLETSDISVGLQLSSKK